MALLFFTGSFSALAQTPAPSGYVFGVHGHWSATNPYVPELQLGQAVHAGQVIQLGNKTIEHCFIHVGYVDNTAAVLDCDKDVKNCQGPLTVKKLAGDSTMMERVGAAWNHLFNHGPVPVVFAISRGTQSKGPQEAVLSLDKDRLDPAPALNDLTSGTYTLTFRAIPENDHVPLRLRCQWKAPAAQCVTAAALTAGLFAMSVSNDEGVAGSPVAVLVASPERFDALTRTFNEWKSATQDWPKETRPETVHYFRTAALDALNQTIRP